MTTKITVFANHGWPVEVTLLDPKSGHPTGPFLVEVGAQADFHAHSGADLYVHEVQPGQAIVGEAIVRADTTLHAGLPVAGYRPQSESNVARVNGHKQDEERMLRKLDVLRHDPAVDQRWLSVGRTALEQAFMAINRAVFRPGRVELDE